MKNKITCLLAGAALFGATANAEIALADGLSASGYIDIVAADPNGGDRTFDSSEFELGLNFAPAESAWSATAELSYDINDAGNDAVNTETVAVTYQHSDSLSFTFGQVYTYQGLESHDAPDNYFISYAGRANANGSTDLYSVDFASGICADYSAGDISLGVWTDAVSGAGYEYYAAYTGIDNLTLAVAIADNDDASETTNIMATYEYGDFTIMAESVESEGFEAEGTGDDLDVTSITVAYAMGDTTLAVRAVDGEYDLAGTDYEKISVSAFKALSDNVAVGVEYSEEEVGAAESEDGFAVELLYVF
jgi:hypothetical protein